MATIQEGPHYELASSELARWLQERAPQTWWNVDGDPLLTGRMSFPCPSDELATELRHINRPLLVQASKTDANAKGQAINADGIPSVKRWLGDVKSAGPPPEGVNDSFFYLCWKGSPHEWLLAEDSETAKQFAGDTASRVK